MIARRRMHKMQAGERYGRLVVMELLPGSIISPKNTRAKVLCDCGEEREVTRGHLRSGHTTSCGCALRNGDFDSEKPWQLGGLSRRSGSSRHVAELPVEPWADRQLYMGDLTPPVPKISITFTPDKELDAHRLHFT